MPKNSDFDSIEQQLEMAGEVRLSDQKLAIDLARKARNAARERGGPGGRRLEGLALVELARNYGLLAQPSQSRDRALEALSIFEGIEDEGGIATACAVLGAGYGLTGEVRQAHDILTRAIEIQRRRGDVGPTTSLVLRNLAVSSLALGMKTEGLLLCDEAIEVLGNLGDQRGEYRARALKAETLFDLGDIEQSVQDCNELLDFAPGCGDPSLEPRVHSLLARVHSQIGDYCQALEHHRRALSLLHEETSRLQYGSALSEIAVTHLKLRAYADARKFAMKALNLWREVGSVTEEANALSILSNISEKEGDAAAALEFAERALVCQRKTSHAVGLTSALIRLGEVHAQNGRCEEALELAQEAHTRAIESGHVQQQASCLSVIGQAHHLSGQYSQAARAFQEAAAIARELGDSHTIAQVAKHAAHAHADAGEYQLAFEALLEHHQVDWDAFREQTDARLEQLRVVHQLDEARYEAREAESLAWKRSAAQLRAIVQNTPHVAITAYTREGELRIWNPAAERIFGYQREEVIGRLAQDLEPFKNENLPFTDILKYAEGADSAFGPSELVFHRRDGSRGTCLSTVFRVVDAEEEMLLARMDVDLSEQKETENALRLALSEVENLKDRLAAENVYLQEEIENSYSYFGEIVGQSASLKRVLHQVEQVAPTNMTALILGETGTGKDLVARAIHRRSLRRDRPLVQVNCAALPAGLIESEFFGHEKGAFTGALDQKIGRFELADEGTIFLDEIGELAPELQAKLLRVLQDGEFERLGSTVTRKVDVRVIAATNRILEQAVERGKFRQDLYYRLSVLPIFVPPLRERKDDLPLLVWHLIRKHAQALGKSIDKVSATTMDHMAEYNWPGNIRELENVIQRAVLLSPASTLTIEEPLADPFSRSNSMPPSLKLEDADRHHILEVLERCDWKIKGQGNAAECLGLPPSTLRLRMKKLGIVRPSPNR